MRKNKPVGVTAAIVFALLSLSFLLTMTRNSHSQQGEEHAKALVTQAVAAIGGEERSSQWTTRVEKGHLTTIWPGWGELHAECNRFVKKPDKMKIDQDFSAFDHPFFFTYYYNGGEAWMMVNLGVRQSPRYTSQLSRQMRTVDGPAYYLNQCDTFFVVSEVADDSLLASAAIERIGVVDNGDTVLFDLDKESHLPLRRIENGGTRHVILEDYRSAGGLKVPFHVTIYEEGKLSSEYVWEEITFGAKIDDAIFEEYRPHAKRTSD